MFKTKRLAAGLLVLALLVAASGTVDWMGAGSAVAQAVLPCFAVSVGGAVHAHGWPAGEVVTVDIDDPDTLQDPDFTAILVPEWNEDLGYAFGSLSITNQFDLEPGHIVTLSGSGMIKEHTVTRLAVTTVDRPSGLVTGIAEPGGTVQVDLFGGEDWSETIYVTADANGDWVVDFEKYITADQWIMAGDNDEDGDGTMYWWSEEWIQSPVNGHYYRWTEALPWLNAEAQAVQWGGHLVTLRSWEEELWIKQMFGDDEHFWIGFNDIETEGAWVWSSGEAVGYTNWCPLEPNDAGDGEDAAVMSWADEPGCEDPCLGDSWNDMGINALFRGVVERSFLPVAIDIKPGSYPNSINLGSKGVVPVAVLTTDEFDASNVDTDTVVFAGASPLRWALEDVDYDGDLDLIFHFKTQELNIDEYSTEATLIGETFDGILIQGTDTVNIVP